MPWSAGFKLFGAIYGDSDPFFKIFRAITSEGVQFNISIE